MCFAMAIANMMNVKLALFENSVLWSLFAELLYYTIYPFLLYLRRLLKSWVPLLMLSFTMALIVAGTNPQAADYPSYGIQLNWLLGLPCWLLGCHLTEKVIGSPAADTEVSIWTWRSGILVASMITSILRFHTPIGYPWTLNFFALVVSLWLSREILHFRKNRTIRLLEWAGSWSYSLYLVHILVIKALSALALPNLGYLLNWAVPMALILASSLLFAVLIELPSHRLARYVGDRLASRWTNWRNETKRE